MHPAGTVLIVDDEESARDVLEGRLLALGYPLITASNGREALQQAAEVFPDVILLDVMMPEMDGFEVCRRLRAHPHLAEVPIILVTALDDRDSRIQGLQAGADDFLSKPVDPVELKARVQTIIRLNRYRRLMTERARFTRLIELSPDGILIVSTEGTILLVNPAMVRMLHVPDEEHLIGKRLCSLIVSQYALPCYTYMEHVLNNPQSVPQVEILFHRQDGTTVPVELNAGYFDWDGKPTVQMIARDITERKRTTEALQQAHHELAEHRQRLQHLVEKLLVAQEEERRRVAYELHDGLAQVAAGAHQHLQTFASFSRPRAERTRRELQHALDLTQRVVREARQVIAGLRPTVLDDFGLVSALRVEIEALRNDGWEITYEESLGQQRLPPVIETALFRVAQETLNNIRKHAGLTRAHLTLQRHAAAVHLEVQDWGHGFDMAQLHTPGKPGECIGLIGMEERMTLLGGYFRIESKPQHGTRVVAGVPLEHG
jgi:PAS domain S-box-containing protein